MFNSNINLKMNLSKSIKSQARCPTMLRYAPFKFVIVKTSLIQTLNEYRKNTESEN